MGAEVIKVEHRPSGGDMARGVGPYFLGQHESEFFQTFNRDKKSLTLDLNSRAGARCSKSWSRPRTPCSATCAATSTGETDGPPARFGLSMLDYMTGMTAGFAQAGGTAI